MTLLRRGIKRLSTLFCVVLLLLHLGAYPLRARATAGALAAVAGVTVLGAYLMASGVYPYISEAGQSLSEWTSDNLQPLIDKYNAYLSSIGKSYQIVLNGAAPTIKGYMTQGAIVIANDVWGKLREFVQWIQSEYALMDNQTGVFLGVSVRGAYPINFTGQTYDSISSSSRYSYIASNGTYLGHDSTLNAPFYMMYFGFSENPSDIGMYYISNSSTLATIRVISTRTFDSRPVGYATKDRYGDNYAGAESWYSNSTPSKTFTFDGISYRIWGAENYYANVRLSTVPADAKVFSSISEAVKDLLGITDTNDFYGITADTGTVIPLESLPADTPWGGLAVQGTSNPAGVVEQGITEREKPVVRPVEVEIQQGTEVDSETGEVTENPVVITPGDVALPASDYQVPGLSGVFPFSLPWDIYRIYSALNAEPVRPEWDVTIYVPILEIQAPMHIGFPEDVAPVVDGFMSLARKLILVLLCVLTLIGVRNLIR